MKTSLPQSFEAACNWTWADYAPHYEALHNTALDSTNVDRWIADWSALYSTYTEVRARLRIQTDLDAADESAAADYQNFMRTIFPEVEKAQFALTDKLLASGLEPAGLAVTLRQIRAKNTIFREVNLPIQVRVDEVVRDYGRIVGGQSISWNGAEKTLVEMKQFNADPDRAVRERAWRAMDERQQADRPAINDIWRNLMGLRQQLYQNAGLENYGQYAWKDRQRIDYSPEDVIQFCEAVEQVVVPVLARIREERRQKLGVAALRPWDTQLEPHDAAPELSNHPVEPVYADAGDLIAKAGAVFNRIDPDLGQFFQIMRDQRWLELENRRGKSPGAYCAALPVSRGAFLFGNASGRAADVGMVLHESGHGFHNFYMNDMPMIVSGWGRPVEFAEVASTAMEFLGMPYLTRDQGGFFEPEQAAHYVLEQLLDIPLTWSYQSIVVLFQHWVYDHHQQGSDPAECDKKWSELWHRYSPAVDYSGLEAWVSAGWHRKQHIFGMPFYYIEYSLAQLGAIQIWANSLQDRAAALESYRSGLKLGNTVSLPQLFAASGAKLAFDAGTLRQGMDFVQEQIEVWSARKG